MSMTMSKPGMREEQIAANITHFWQRLPVPICSVLSNHLASSHDIAVTIGDMERFKHQVSGISEFARFG